jgi:nicotinamide-nucleotide amidase
MAGPLSPNSPAPLGGNPAPRFELLTLGDELLLGLTANSHLTWIGAQLGRRGVQLQRNVTISDDAAAIAAQFAESWARAEVIITTGGLGPTCDDRTREVVADILGQELVFDAEIMQAIEDRFARLNRPCTPNNRKQAFKFSRGEVLPNPNGTAPGLWVQQDGKVLVMLPGPPNELQPLFTDLVLPRLAQLGLVAESEAYVQLRTAGVGESALEMRFQPIFDRHPGLGVAFCAHQWQVDCRLSSPDHRYSRAVLDRIAGECRTLLGDDFVCFGHDTLAQVVSDHLRHHGRTLAVAESCTGGLLANSFTDVCGASKFFMGGIVSYSNDSKTLLLDCPECLLSQHGAVSAECAVAMACGVAEQLSSDYGLAITGYAGPTGGHEGAPAGTIYIGLHSPLGDWSKKLSYSGQQRGAVKQRAVTAAIDWLRREVAREAHRAESSLAN